MSSPAAPAALPAGARLAVVLLLLINLFNYIDRFVLAAVENPIAKELLPEAGRLNDAKMGTLQTAFLVSYMVLAPLFGWMADRTSRWTLMGVGVILWSLASAGSGWAGTFGLLFATRCLVGVGEAAYGPAAPAVLSDLFPEARRGRVLAWFYAAIPVGSALGYVLGGVALKYFGWRWAFYCVLPPGLLLGVWCFLMPEPARGQSELAAPTRHARARDYLILLRTRSYVLNTLGMTALTFAVGGIAFWMPHYIYEIRRGPSLETTNMIFGAIVVVSGLVATLLGGWAGDRLRDRFPSSYFLVSGVSMLAAFPSILLVLVTPFPWAWAFVFLAVFFLFFNTGPTNTALANVTHPAMRATAYAINIFVIHALGDAAYPPVIGAIAGATGDWNVAFLVVSVTVLLGGLLWLWGTRYLERDTARAPLRLQEADAGQATRALAGQAG